jgi:acyl-CoA thioester hydrolase
MGVCHGKHALQKQASPDKPIHGLKASLAIRKPACHKTRMTDRPKSLPRSAFRHFMPLDTRWHDNDVFGHVNNVVYYAYFDTAVNRHLMDAGLLDPKTSAIVGLVVETGCTYFESVAYPERLEVGMAVLRLGRSSVTYRLGLFREGGVTCVALCLYTHVYVDRASNKPVEIPEGNRRLFEEIVV